MAAVEQEPIVLIREHLQEAVVTKTDRTTNVLRDRIISLVLAVLADQKAIILLQGADREVVEAAQEVVAQNPEVPVHLQEVVLANIKI